MSKTNKLNSKLAVGFILIAVLISIVLYIANIKSTESEITSQNEADKTNKNLKQADPKKNTLVVNPASPKEEKQLNDTPIENGVKARHAPITIKSELYTDEFVLHREESISIDPTPIRPKEPFIRWVLQFSGSVAGSILSNED